MALIPKYFPDCVVAIGVPSEEEQTEWIASGFLYGDFWKEENGERIYYIYLSIITPAYTNCFINK